VSLNSLSQETHAIQSTLARIVRTGEMEPLPGIHSEERIVTYREIVLTAFSNSLARAYPIAKKALGEASFDTLVRLFIAKHDVQPVELWKMPEGFYDFICHGEVPSDLKPDYLEDLLLFEWAEIAVTMMEDVELDAIPTSVSRTELSSTWADFAKHSIYVNPHFEVIRLRYPLFKLKPSEALLHPGDFFVVCYRHCESLKPHYLAVSPLIAQLLLSLKEHPACLATIIADISQEFELTLDDNAKNTVMNFVCSGLESGMVLSIFNPANAHL
jgi:hypothetical protein